MRHNRLRKQGENTKEKRTKDRLMTFFLVISIILFAGSVTQTSKKIGKVNKEVKDREEQLRNLQSEEKKLEEKYQEVTSNEYMEKQLRNQLNLSKENEITLVLPEDELLRKLVPTDDFETEVDLTPNYKKWARVFGVEL